MEAIKAGEARANKRPRKSGLQLEEKSEKSVTLGQRLAASEAVSILSAIAVIEEIRPKLSQAKVLAAAVNFENYVKSG